MTDEMPHASHVKENNNIRFQKDINKSCCCGWWAYRYLCSTDSGRRIGIGRILICRPVHSRVQAVSAGFPTQPTGRQFPRLVGFLCCAEGCSLGWVGLGCCTVSMVWNQSAGWLCLYVLLETFKRSMLLAIATVTNQWLIVHAGLGCLQLLPSRTKN